MELPDEIRVLLKPSQLRRFNELTEPEQQQFLYDFSKQKVNPTLLLICTIFGVHYFYLKQIGRELLFLITGGGALIWWILDMINYRKKAEEYNQALIQKLL
jgi:TM2 domain-containing membrane protein YozV